MVYHYVIVYYYKNGISLCDSILLSELDRNILVLQYISL